MKENRKDKYWALKVIDEKGKLKYKLLNPFSPKSINKLKYDDKLNFITTKETILNDKDMVDTVMVKKKKEKNNLI